MCIRDRYTYLKPWHLINTFSSLGAQSKHFCVMLFKFRMTKHILILLFFFLTITIGVRKLLFERSMILLSNIFLISSSPNFWYCSGIGYVLRTNLFSLVTLISWVYTLVVEWLFSKVSGSSFVLLLLRLFLLLWFITLAVGLVIWTYFAPDSLSMSIRPNCTL